MTSPGSSSYVSVPVPEHLVLAVMALITERSATAASTTTPMAPSSAASKIPEPAWSEAELKKVWDESGLPIRNVLKLLAGNPGHAVSAAEVAKARNGGSTAHQVAGMMGAFGRRLKNRHPGKPWPFEAKVNGATGGWEYVMSAEVAAIVVKF